MFGFFPWGVDSFFGMGAGVAKCGFESAEEDEDVEVLELTLCCKFVLPIGEKYVVIDFCVLI